ncbi:hypothetical protein CW711_01315 [Candidatus Bathyarchaeota archaeon]|nr:MAG: hypothetical protein CW711_01315 [Candidatus Bathyarchaeota archaeon]
MPNLWSIKMVRLKDNLEISMIISEDNVKEAISRAELIAKNLNLKLLGVYQVYRPTGHKKR